MDDPKHWRYNPITELAKLMAARPAHIVMDVNAPGELVQLGLFVITACSYNALQLAFWQEWAMLFW